MGETTGRNIIARDVHNVKGLFKMGQQSTDKDNEDEMRSTSNIAEQIQLKGHIRDRMWSGNFRHLMKRSRED